MGRKQKLKTSRHSQAQATKPTPAAFGRSFGGKALPWILGLLVFLGLLIVGAVYFIKARNIQPANTAIQLETDAALQSLNRYQGRFSLDESNRLRRVLEGVRLLAWTRTPDLPALSRLNFIVRVSNEIIDAGNLDAGELEKLETILDRTRRDLERRASQPPARARP